MYARRLVLFPDNLFDRFRVNLGRGQQRSKVDIASIDDLFLHNRDARHRIASGQILNHQPAEYQLRRGCADIDAHALNNLLHDVTCLLEK